MASELKASDAMMVFLTLVIAGTGVVGIVLVIQGGKDTKRLVDAAENEARAAQRNADAARVFPRLPRELTLAYPRQPKS